MATMRANDIKTWQEQHTTLLVAWTMFVALFHYVFEGHIIVGFMRWVILFSSNVSESALSLSVLWITAIFVVPDLTARLGTLEGLFTSFSMIALSVIPEVILPSAIIKTIRYCREARDRRAYARTWAILYGLPTFIFAGMTLYTLFTFAGQHGHIQSASGMALVFRCIAGWFYALIGVVHGAIGLVKGNQETHVHIDRVKEIQQQLHSVQEMHAREIEQIQQTIQQQIQTTIAEVEGRLSLSVSDAVSSLVSPVSNTSTETAETSDTPKETTHPYIQIQPINKEPVSQTYKPVEAVSFLVSDTDRDRVIQASKEVKTKREICPYLGWSTSKYPVVKRVLDEYQRQQIRTDNNRF